MSPDLVAAIARTTRQIADTLDIPHDRAEHLVAWMQRDGWRLHPELAGGPTARPRQADPRVRAQCKAEIDATIEAARRRHQEPQR